MMNVKNLIVIYLLLLNTAIFAQDKPVVFERVSTRDGLSQNNVFAITQDQKGFIWMGTEDGLNRYDGYNFTVFKKTAGDTSSLSDSWINTVYINRTGILWVGTLFGGLSQFNSSDESFISYQHDHINPKSICSNRITAIHEDATGNLWIGSAESGFDYFDISNKTFAHFNNMLPAGYEIESGRVNFIHQDRNNLLWVGGNKKIHVFLIDFTKNKIPQLYPQKVKNQDLSSAALSIEEDEEGNIWIGTYADGLLCFHNSTKMLQKYNLKDAATVNRNFPIHSIESHGSEELWLGGEGLGLIKLNPKTGDQRLFRNNPLSETSLVNNMVLSVFRDRTGVLWVGTRIGGFNKYDPSVVKFRLYQKDPNNPNGLQISAFRGFYEDSKKFLWICTAGGGLYALNRNTGQYTRYIFNPDDPNSISSNFLRCIYEDNEKNLWIGTLSGFNKFNRKNNAFKRFYIDAANIQNRINGLNYTMMEIPAYPGYLWFGTTGAGLVRFDKENETIKSYTYDPERVNSLNNRDNDVRTLFYSKARPEELWLGTTHGINIFNLKTETFKYFVHDPKDDHSLSNDNVMHIYEDEQGFIWVGTYGGGLNRFDPETKKFKRYTVINSDLPSDAVYVSLPDEQGNLWLSTNRGLSKFNPETEIFRNYTVDDGLQGEEFNGGSYYKTDSGEMFLGGVEGFNSFYPKEVVDNPHPPELAITDLKIFNESVKIGADSPLSSDISEINEITLDYWQNDISFDFVALHFARSSRNRYAFQLENYDRDWRFAGETRIATYTNLDPGPYVFRVKGSNNDGIWNEEGKSIRLTINPPWWRTNLAYVLYLALLALLIFAIDRFQRRRIRQKEAEKLKFVLLEAENERKSKELEEARDLQLSMLPKKLPEIPNLDIAVYMQTATEVGGDYYDFNVSMDGTLTIVVGDATGHGMKAGTVVTATKSLFNSHAQNPDILFTFDEISRSLKKMHMRQLAMCLTLAKIQGNQLKLSAAGMPPALMYKPKSDQVEELLVKGMPLGAVDKFSYQIIDRKLDTGDTILFLSDGLPELFNKKKEMLGYEKVTELFLEAATRQPEEIIEHLKTAGFNWVQDHEPEDDVTFVVIKVK